MKKEIKNLQELQVVAKTFLEGLLDMPPKKTATVVGLSGDLGSGKTAFTKCVATALGITEAVTSPTFIIEKIYTIPALSIADSRFSKLIHIDAYRLEKGEEMDSLDWSSTIKDSNNLVFLEWPGQVESALPEDITMLSFEHVSENESTRSIEGDLI